jgi:hypothetical protein
MQIHNHYTQQKLILDERLLSTLQELGIIETKAEFSQMCGKNDSYYGCMKARGYGIHLGSLVFLTAKLSQQMDTEQNVRERARLRSAIEAINSTIHEKCRLRELELLS